MRDYGKVFSTFWTSDSTRGLSDDGKVLALYLLTGPHSNIIGCYRLPDGYASEDLGWTPQRVSKGFGELFQKGFATREESSKWVFVHKHLKWNPLENPNQITGAIKLYDQIPDTSSVKPLMATALQKYTSPNIKGFETLPKPLGNPSETLSKPLGNPSETLSKPETETGSRTGSETETGEGESRARARATPPEKSRYGENGNVLLTREEHAGLCRKFTPELTQKAIAFLDLHIGAKGRNEYKSHNLAMQKWVFDAVKEREFRQARASPGAPPGAWKSTAQRRLEANNQAADEAEILLFGKRAEETNATG